MLTNIYLLIVLVAPLLIVVLLRFLRTRMSAIPFYSIGGILFALVGLVVIVLVRGNQPTVQFGNLVVIRPQGVDVAVRQNDIPPEIPEQPIVEPTSPVRVPEQSSTPAPSATASPRPTASATATTAATSTAPPTPTSEPTATLEPTNTPVPQPQTRRYTVQPGDTLGKIALRFDVSVADILEANDLTPSQGDALQVGDVLIIP